MYIFRKFEIMFEVINRKNCQRKINVNYEKIFSNLLFKTIKQFNEMLEIIGSSNC